ncbi:hypothetical protein BY996DRAFT_6420067 [Phakopsora pachyrhizi]|uniref:Expressed protein n=1 Tax=Phakopsora pachyrhizi TaxID=170000 RepID=A0AAV0BD09_PHAPC|nr:hypothetical protein BY996DRAFT_6420067 [Phakopsora pachyrhizi]CAH7684293.1 expressed protein [Phakopsora pachyrhizi]
MHKPTLTCLLILATNEAVVRGASFVTSSASASASASASSQYTVDGKVVGSHSSSSAAGSNVQVDSNGKVTSSSWHSNNGDPNEKDCDCEKKGIDCDQKNHPPSDSYPHNFGDSSSATSVTSDDYNPETNPYGKNTVTSSAHPSDSDLPSDYPQVDKSNSQACDLKDCKPTDGAKSYNPSYPDQNPLVSSGDYTPGSYPIQTPGKGTLISSHYPAGNTPKSEYPQEVNPGYNSVGESGTNCTDNFNNSAGPHNSPGGYNPKEESNNPQSFYPNYNSQKSDYPPEVTSGDDNKSTNCTENDYNSTNPHNPPSLVPTNPLAPSQEKNPGDNSANCTESATDGTPKYPLGRFQPPENPPVTSGGETDCTSKNNGDSNCSPTPAKTYIPSVSSGKGYSYPEAGVDKSFDQGSDCSPTSDADKTPSVSSGKGDNYPTSGGYKSYPQGSDSSQTPDKSYIPSVSSGNGDNYPTSGEDKSYPQGPDCSQTPDKSNTPSVSSGKGNNYPVSGVDKPYPQGSDCSPNPDKSNTPGVSSGKGDNYPASGVDKNYPQSSDCSQTPDKSDTPSVSSGNGDNYPTSGGDKSYPQGPDCSQTPDKSNTPSVSSGKGNNYPASGVDKTYPQGSDCSPNPDKSNTPGVSSGKGDNYPTSGEDKSNPQSPRSKECDDSKNKNSDDGGDGVQSKPSPKNGYYPVGKNCSEGNDSSSTMSEGGNPYNNTLPSGCPPNDTPSGNNRSSHGLPPPPPNGDNTPPGPGDNTSGAGSTELHLPVNSGSVILAVFAGLATLFL